MSKWPSREYDMIMGDINAHSTLWDRTVERADRRGVIVENWIATKNMAPANDGSPTHTNRTTGKETAPDTTFVHPSLLDRISWTPVSELGGSDHSPIIITYGTEMKKSTRSRYTCGDYRMQTGVALPQRSNRNWQRITIVRMSASFRRYC